MGQVIFLNGCGSSGKTSIATAIQHLSDRPWFHLSMDTLITMMPQDYTGFGSKAKEGYFYYIATENLPEAPQVTVEVTPEGSKIFELLPKLAGIFLETGQNLIIDEVLFGDRILKSYIKAFERYRTTFVGVFCDLERMQEREYLRGDRVIGLSKDQIHKVHAGLRAYDLTVDTSNQSPFQSAQQILTFLHHKPLKTGFEKMTEIIS